MPFKVIDGVKKYTHKEVIYNIDDVIIAMRPLTLEKVGKIVEDVMKDEGDIFGDANKTEKKKGKLLELIKQRLDNPNVLTIALRHILVKKEDDTNLTDEFIKKKFDPEFYKEIWKDFNEINEKEFLMEQVIPFVIAMGQQIKDQNIPKLAGKESVSSQLTES